MSEKSLDAKEEEEIRVAIEELLNSHVEEHRKNTTILHRDGEEILPRVLDYVYEMKEVDNESILYFPEKYSFSLDDFNLIFNSVSEYLDEINGYSVDEGNVFENKSYYIQYKNEIIEFFIMWGQGTFTAIRTFDQEECNIPEDLLGTIEGWQGFIDKEFKKLKSE